MRISTYVGALLLCERRVTSALNQANINQGIPGFEEAAKEWRAEHVAAMHRRDGIFIRLMRRLGDMRLKSLGPYADEYYTDDEIPGTCGECGGPLQIVRPGKQQCPECGQEEL